MTDLRLDRLSKSFGGRNSQALVVNELTLSVPHGEFVSLLGPSGCGKTTTLRMIAGLESPTAGSIWLNDQDVTRTPVQSRKLSMVFQTYAIFPHMKVAANIGYGLRVHGMPRDLRAERVRHVAALVGIEGLLDRMPRQLSGGQRQRVALARALARDAELILFDEPLSNLDAKLRDQTRAELKRIHQSLGNTMVYVTHDQLEALTLSDRIAIMNDGVLQQAGTPSEVYHEPTNLFVAEFIGTPAMNLFAATATRDPAGASVHLTGGTRIGVRGDLWCPQAPAVTAGIRPQRLEIVPSQGDGHDWVITVLEPIGSEAIAHLERDSVTLRSLIPYPAKVAVGDKVGLSVSADALLFFDTGTGARLTP